MFLRKNISGGGPARAEGCRQEDTRYAEKPASESVS